VADIDELTGVVFPGARTRAVIRMLEGDREFGQQLLHPKYVQRKPWRNARRPQALDVRQAIPDLKITAEDAVESGDKVVVRWRAEGTHTGELANIPPSGAKVSFTGINIYRFAGGKVVESWGQYDAISLAQACTESAQIYEYLAKTAAVANR
jgi:predicted ester cyclase